MRTKKNQKKKKRKSKHVGLFIQPRIFINGGSIVKKFGAILVLAVVLALTACGKTVTINFPAEFFAGEDTQAITEQFKTGEGNKKVAVNDDGSVTLVVTEKKYNLIVENMASMIEEMYATIGQEDSFFQTVKAFEHNDDYTSLTITVDREAFEASNEPESVDQIIYVARLYQVYALKNDAVITVTYIDEADGEAYREDMYTAAGDFPER